MQGSTSGLPKVMDVAAASRPLKIAVVYSRIPLPMRHADQLTVAHLLSFLKARGHAVDLYTIEAGGQAEKAHHDWLEAHCRRVKLYPHSKAHIARGMAKLLQGAPVQVGLFSHADQIADLRQAAREEDYDIIYTYYFRSAEATRGLNQVVNAKGKRNTTFLALQLSQALNTERIAANAPNLALKLFYQMESRLVADYESRIWRDFTKSVLIGPKDVEAITKVCQRLGRPPISNWVYGAHGTDVQRFGPRQDVVPREDHLVFSGVMRTPTNVQAVQWFARHVWPQVKAARPGVTLDIVGREPSGEVRELERLEGVRVTGSVPDTAVNIAEAAVCINPMQAGGGMQNKLLEYLGCAKAVVATSVANEGIGGVSGRHLIVADSPSDFANAVISLLESPDHREGLGKAGREFVLENWTWESHFLKLEADFYRAIDGQTPADRVEA
ncbi:glycosyltransferase [Xanthobacter autotrophicus DSM 597]|uniref:glycosyltransferase n=1 Tax=Xanthobacter wiegelii TaxID=3119913 RepID=UPI00372BBBAB